MTAVGTEHLSGSASTVHAGQLNLRPASAG